MQLIIHEIFHILGFGDFENFRNPSGGMYDISEVIGTETRRGKSVKIVKTPKVLEKARNAFNCPSLTGLELEDSDPNITSKHWEKLHMFNDFMVEDPAIFDVIYTDISLALLEDTGKYIPNYQYS